MVIRLGPPARRGRAFLPGGSLGQIDRFWVQIKTTSPGDQGFGASGKDSRWNAHGTTLAPTGPASFDTLPSILLSRKSVLSITILQGPRLPHSTLWPRASPKNTAERTAPWPFCPILLHKGSESEVEKSITGQLPPENNALSSHKALSTNVQSCVIHNSWKSRNNPYAHKLMDK
jgi:hypothetical protein